MPEKYKTLLEHLPFFIGAAGSVKMNYTRIVEAILIIILTTIGSSYFTTNRVMDKLTLEHSYLSDRVTVIERTVDGLHPRGYPKIPE